MGSLDDLTEDLTRLVRSALTHLYDYAYLENHPLAALVDAARDLDQVTRAQKLRRLLLDCIEEIKPQEMGDPASEADRVYAILTYRYVDGLPMDKVAEKRGLGVRQTYRALEKGVKAIAGLLQDRMHAQSEGAAPVLPSASDQVQLAQAEVARLRQAARAESLDLRDLLQGVLALLAPLCQRTGAQITLSPPGPWPSVIAQRVMLRQTLLNLLSHALDATGQSHLAISVSPGTGVLCIEIAEPSTGAQALPPAAIASPSGVRLTMAQALLEAQGGRLEIGEREGRFWTRVLLPTSGRATILVIDDNADLVTLLQRYLAGHAIDVVGATDGEQALRLAQDLRPRLITLDVMMPDKDGWEVLQRLKGSPATQGVPVVICSVLDERRLAEAMGAADYITKPVSQDDLLAVLGRWLGPLQPAA